MCDPELRDKIIETHTDMKHVRKSIERHDDEMEELRNQHDERIRVLEQTQSKLMATVLVVGSGITVIMNGILWIAAKIWK